MSFNPTDEQKKILENKLQKTIVSASAGTGKTATIINYIAKLIKSGEKIKRMLIVTFTNNAANEMKERLLDKLLKDADKADIQEQIDDVMTADISTIHAYLQKIIKQNIDKFSISENYSIPTQTKSEDLKRQAFSLAYQQACKSERFENLLLSLSKEKNLLKEMVESLEEHFSVQQDCQKSLEFYKQHQSKIFDEAQRCLNKKLVEGFYSFAGICEKIILQTSSDNKNFKYLQNYKAELQKIASENTLRENLAIMKAFNFGRVSDSKQLSVEFLSLKDEVKSIIDEYKNFDPKDEKQWKVNGIVEDVYDFYDLYIKNLEILKSNENLLEFNDLEKFTNILMQDERILNELQNDFDYVFVDEYQDTNPVQEKIIKLISKNSNFMVVGDPKQGIYGFRNATSQIMKNDIKSLENGDGQVYYLKTNFRSDPHILNFVNLVFENVMFDKTTGVDYKNSSMFKGEAKFNPSEFPPVRIDVLNEMTKEKEEKKLEEVYDITNDRLEVDQKNMFEAEVIATRVQDLVMSNIFDTKTEKYRKVNYSDITILVRGKGSLVDRILEVFSRKKIPVVSSLQSNIFENEEIEVLLNYLKIAVDIKDDVALASAMASKLGGFSLDALCQMRQKSDEKKYFYEVVLQDEGAKDFLDELENFKLNVFSKGIKSAFLMLFTNHDYYSYLLSKNDGVSQKNYVEKFLDIILSSGYNQDIPALIKYLQAGELKSPSTLSGTNAVSIMSIHASKGLEYPIVMLAGMEKEISKKMTGNSSKFSIDNDFGLGIVSFDYENETKKDDIVLKAIKQKKQKREFIDEIMLLYVAMTRAKNHLYIVGKQRVDENAIENPEDIFKQKSYMDLILNGLKTSCKQSVDGVEINNIEEVEQEQLPERKIITGKDIYSNQIRNYLDFVYPFLDSTKLRFKNSVTGINSKDEETKKEFALSGEENLETGNAYHKALELLDFEKINCVADIENSLPEDMTGIDLINKDILFKNINILKEKTRDLKIYKEKQFTMTMSSREIQENLPDEKIMIQGIVDLFAIGRKNILIDYKYSNIKIDDVLREKYKKQLFLYKKAIEKAYNLKLDEIYLLSLKYARIIEIK